MINKKLLKQLNDFVPTDKEICYVNIGTPKLICDTLAPLFGTLIKEKGIDIEVYGTLDAPLHALNLEVFNSFISTKDKFIIAIDSCMGCDTNVKGEIYAKCCPIYPGKGVGKKLTPIGDISIIGITLFKGDNPYNNNLSLSMVYEMAKDLVDTIIAFENERKNKKVVDKI